METIAEESEQVMFQEFDNTSPSHLEDITLDLDPSETMSPFSDTVDTMCPTSTSMCGRTVKEYEEQLRVLKKDNFNLKLRIYFLEERMSKFRMVSSGDADEDAERKLIELKVELEGLRREMKNKHVLLAQAGKAIELMEEQHNSELQKLRREMQESAARNKSQPVPPLPMPHQRQFDPLDNSMQLYADAFNMHTSMLVPPAGSQAAVANAEQEELRQQLLQCQQELEASRERERQLADALESKEPEIQIKVQELTHKDNLLEEQRKIIVEIQIRLDEKQKQLETLRQSLEASQATATRLEAEQASLQQQLRDSEEKRNKSCKVVQTLMTKTQQLNSELREIKERHSKAEWEARQQPPDEIGEMTSEETERLWAELDQQRRHVERLNQENCGLLREKAAVEQELRQELADAKLQLDRALRPGSTVGLSGEIGPTAKVMLGRLDELAAFLSALLRRPHLLAGLSPANRASLLQAVEQSWDKTRKRYSLSLSLTWQPDVSDAADLSIAASTVPADEESLIKHMQSFLHGPETEELVSEVEAQCGRNAELWPVSFSGALDAGKEMELIPWESQRGHDEEEEEDGGGATAVEREAPGSHNQSESEAWSEPDRSVSMARIGLPESCTPAPVERGAPVSPASSEADLVTRTPGKRASVRRLANRLRDSEQINEALRAELGAYKSLYKSQGSPTSPQTPEQQAALLGVPSVLREMESQRSHLESLVKQNDVIRQQLELTRLSSAAKGDDPVRLHDTQLSLQKSQLRVTELEGKLTGAQERCTSLESQLAKVQNELSLQVTTSTKTEQTLAELQASEAHLQQQLEEARSNTQLLEQQAEQAARRMQQLETAATHDAERCVLLSQQVNESQAQCKLLQEEISEQQHILSQQMEQSQAKCKMLQEQISHQQDLLAYKPECSDTSIQTSETDFVVDHNSTGPSSLLHLSDCDDVFHNDTSTLADQSATAIAPLVEEENHRHALSSPDLGIESDNGRMSSLEAPPSPGLSPNMEQNRLQDENWRLKQRLAQSQQLMEACLSAMCRKNKARQEVQASMEEQLRRTEAVLVLAKANLRSLAPTSPSIPESDMPHTQL